MAVLTTASNLQLPWTAQCLCLPVLLLLPTNTALERCPQEIEIYLAVKIFDCLLEQPLEVMARLPAGAQAWTQTQTLQPDHWQQVVKISSPPNTQKNSVGFEFF